MSYKRHESIEFNEGINDDFKKFTFRYTFSYKAHRNKEGKLPRKLKKGW